MATQHLETQVAGEGVDLVVGPIAQALSIRPDEVSRVRWLFVAALSLGFSLVLFYSASNAAFLARFSAGAFGWVYVVNGVVTIALGLVYSRYMRRVGTGQALVRAAALLAASVVVLWVLAITVDSDAVAFMLATWFRCLFIFSVLGLWEIASALFDVRQAKRLFPAVALGMMVAFVLGGAVTAPLTALIGTTHLLVASAVAMFVHALWLALVVRVPDHGAALLATQSVAPAGPADLLRSPFTRRLGEMRTVTILLIYLSEVVFYDQAAKRFETEESLAGFLGGYLAIMTLAMVVVGAVITAWWIRRFGVRVGLASLPVGGLLLGLVGIIWVATVGTEGSFFVAVAVMYGVVQILVNAIEPPVGALLFQPLPSSRRMPVRVAVDGWLGSAALVLVGVLLLVLRVLPFDIVVPVLVAMTLVGLWGVRLAYLLFGMYRDLLRSSTTVGFQGDSPALAGAGLLPWISDLDQQTEPADQRSQLEEMLTSHDQEMIRLALAVTHQLPEAPATLTDALSSVAQRTDIDKDLRCDALLTLAHCELEIAAAIAHELALEPVSSAISLASANDQHEAAAPLLATTVPGTNGRQLLQTAAAYESLVIAYDLDQAVSSDFMQRRVAFVHGDDPEDVLAGLAPPPMNPSASLCRAALARGRNPRFARPAADLLVRAPATMLESVQTEIANADDRWASTLTSRVLPALTRRPTVLYPAVEPGRPALQRRAGLDAIARAQVMAPASPARMLADDADFVRLIATAWRDLAGGHRTAIIEALRWALNDEFLHTRRAILSALELGANTQEFRDLAIILGRSASTGGADLQRANAVEALDVALDPQLRRLVVPLIEPHHLADAVLDGLAESEERTAHDWLAVLAHDGRCSTITRRLAHLARTHDSEDPMTSLLDHTLALRSIDIFSTLPLDLAAELAERSEARSYDAGEHLIEAGALGSELFALTSGSADIVVDGRATSRIQSGTVVGELAVLDPAPRSANVVAAEPCTALVVDRSTLFDLAEHRPEVMTAIATVLARRLRFPETGNPQSGPAEIGGPAV